MMTFLAGQTLQLCVCKDDPAQAIFSFAQLYCLIHYNPTMQRAPKSYLCAISTSLWPILDDRERAAWQTFTHEFADEFELCGSGCGALSDKNLWDKLKSLTSSPGKGHRGKSINRAFGGKSREFTQYQKVLVRLVFL
jgi:hypothetical protein